MKTSYFTVLFASATSAMLPAAVTISVTNNAPNGSASGGSGSGTGSLTTSLGGISSDRSLPSTTYTVSDVDLTSLGGQANENFTFTITYTATTNGITPGSPQYSGFGNVAVTGNNSNQVDGDETLTATIALSSSSFSGLSLVGFTSARAGGVTDGEAGTFTWSGGGIYNISPGNLVTNDVTGNTFTLQVSSGNMTFEGFSAEFVAVPEPASACMLIFGALPLLYRRRNSL